MILIPHFTKQCTKCKETKQFKMFDKNKLGKSNLHANCKICRKNYRKNNPELMKKTNNSYYESNKE